MTNCRDKTIQLTEWALVSYQYSINRIGFRAARLITWSTIVFAAGSIANAQLTTLRIEDYAEMPLTGELDGNSNSAYLARVNFMTDDPANSNQFVVNDLNGQMYFLDKTTRQFTEYLNFDGRSGAPGLFDRLWTSAGFAGGLITFEFDPGYADVSSPGYGKFYTSHLERGDGSKVPDTSNYPNLDVSGYDVTSAVPSPSGGIYQQVLIEWTDTDVSNHSFEGSARELLRLDARDRIHPLGDIIYNPIAGPDDPDWRVMYLAVGDFSNGEQTNLTNRRTPQLLNTLGGKVLRIAPDDDVNIATSLSPNGKYYIPDDNPFTDVANSNVRDEIWALGLRNPHRLSWDVDPANPEDNYLIANDIGLHTWEEVNIIHKGLNYGYSEREGNERLERVGSGTQQDPFRNEIAPLPDPDSIPNHLICTGGSSGFSFCTSDGTVTPTYPVIQYGHAQDGQSTTVAGDAISSGFVYRGSKIPQLYGKYLFGDITTGALYYADFEEMVAADDGDPSTLATIHSLDVLWDNPEDPPDEGEELYTTIFTPTPDDEPNVRIHGPLFQIVNAAYHNRGGEDPDLPSGANITDAADEIGLSGRADIRIAMDSKGELYILSKSDGWIRQIVGPDPEPGDYNYDGVVNAADYQKWVDTFGQTVPVAGLGADGNEDGNIDAADYTVWRDNLTNVGSGSLLISAPEPTCGIHLLFAVVCIAISRRGQRR